MPAITRRALPLLALASTALAQPAPALAYPLRLVVPFTPGGSVDIIARLMAEGMRAPLGQPVIVENRPGANGVIAVQAVARARADGTTAMVGNVTTNGTAPLLAARTLGLDYERDLVPVLRIADVPSLLVATTVNYPPRTVAELVADARARPGRVNYVSTGVGGYTHVDTVILARAAGIEIEHVVLSGGGGPSMQSLLSGDIQFGWINVATAAPMVQSGGLKALAVTAAARLPEFPDVPTMAEAGYPGIGTPAWHIMMVPSGVPPATLEALFAAAITALNTDTVRAAFRRQFIQPNPSASPAEAATWFHAELARWRTILTDLHIAETD